MWGAGYAKIFPYIGSKYFFYCSLILFLQYNYFYRDVLPPIKLLNNYGLFFKTTAK